MLQLIDILHGVAPEHHYDATLVPPLRISDVAIDSRLVMPGALFVALVGETVDGHDYVAAAAKSGAVVALVAIDKGVVLALQYGWALVVPGQPVPTEWHGPLLIGVLDPLTALQQLAAWYRRRFAPAWVVGITGSVGKTSTKEVVAALVSAHLPTLKSPRSYNSESTLPLVALQMDDTHQAAVFEMGMYTAGEIALLAHIAQPNIGVVTTVGPSHLERMGSIERIAAAKAELIQALPATGVAILNGDDERVAAMAGLTVARVVRYGLHADADVRAVDIVPQGLAGTQFRVLAPGIDDVVHLHAPGLHQVRNLLAGIAVGITIGIPWATMRTAINNITQLRFVLYSGISNTQIIDDSYNAAPTSMRAALELLGTVQSRRVAVLGDMRELGHIEESAHSEVGQWVAGVADVLIAVGSRGRWIAEGARQAGMTAVATAPDAQAALAVVRAHIQPGDCVLIKGSRAMAMEQIVADLRADGASASKES